MNLNKLTCVGMIFHPPSLKSMMKAMRVFLPRSAALLEKTLGVKKTFFSKIPPIRCVNLKNVESQKGVNINLYGYLITLFPNDFYRLDKKVIHRKLINLINRAGRDGVKIATLGAFASIITDQGADIVDKVNIPITSGNTYTAALCIFAVLEICEKLEVDIANSTLCVVGATGNVGGACAHYLSGYFGRIILCSRNINESDELVTQIRKKGSDQVIIIRDAASAVRAADVIICAVSSFYPVFSSEDIKPGTILCDISIPSSFDERIRDRTDIIAFEGGRAKIFNYNKHKHNKVWSHLFPHNAIFGCLAESMILAFENRFENYSIGREIILGSKIKEIFDLGIKHGYSYSDFCCVDRSYSEEDFLTVRKKIQQNN